MDSNLPDSIFSITYLKFVRNESANDDRGNNLEKSIELLEKTVRFNFLPSFVFLFYIYKLAEKSDEKKSETCLTNYSMNCII